MNKNLSVSVILPIKSSKTRDFNEYFEKAITSLKNQKTQIEELVIVHTQEESLVTILDSYDFGTFPLESMSCNVPCLGKIPDLSPEWMTEDNGIWVTDSNGKVPNPLLSSIQTLKKHSFKAFENSFSDNPLISLNVNHLYCGNLR